MPSNKASMIKKLGLAGYKAYMSDLSNKRKTKSGGKGFLDRDKSIAALKKRWGK